MRKPRRVVKPHQFPVPDPDLDAKWEIKMDTKNPDYYKHWNSLIDCLTQPYIDITEQNKETGSISFVKYEAYMSLNGAAHTINFMLRNGYAKSATKVWGKYGTDFKGKHSRRKEETTTKIN